MPKTASCSIQSATTGFTANILPHRNRVSLTEAFEGLEPDEAKAARPVLRGLGPSNGSGYPVSLQGRAGRQRTVLEPLEKCIHARKSGTETARPRCICQH